MGMIRVGLSSWTDVSLIKSGRFYPEGVDSAEERLRYYASQFPLLVEVNSTYYGLPSERNSRLWDERTPEDFVFDVKMFSLVTQHPTQPRSIPKDIREQLDAETLDKGNIYFHHIPKELSAEVMARFVDALQPLHQSGKLGAILLQFPRWFFPGSDSFSHIEWVREHLGGYRAAVEFRNQVWLDDEHQEDTFDFLKEHELTYVVVDEPQGFSSSVPPLAVVTDPDLAYVRFHGRRRDTWEKSVSVQERYKYLYGKEELQEWVPKIEGLAEQAQEVHVLFNTNFEDYAVRGARQLRLLLDEAQGQGPGPSAAG